MSFIRRFDSVQKNELLRPQNAELFARLKADVISGRENEAVFPAVRNNELHFYYKGGCLYKFARGAFRRDEGFERFDKGTEGLDSYEKAKKQVENKFTNACGGAAERRLLNGLYHDTFSPRRRFNVVVLDIEVNLNGEVGRRKKCDLVFLNTATDELMFVEGKVFSDPRVNVLRGRIPEVIKQVDVYSAAIGEQCAGVLEQYKEHVKTVNELFGTQFQAPRGLVSPAKLLVYQKPERLTENGSYSQDTIEDALGRGNVVWYRKEEKPSPDDIWSALCK